MGLPLLIVGVLLAIIIITAGNAKLPKGPLRGAAAALPAVRSSDPAPPGCDLAPPSSVTRDLAPSPRDLAPSPRRAARESKPAQPALVVG